jgi:pSer/pThr/pTyr-binding forkhead associated (FHA) protein
MDDFSVACGATGPLRLDVRGPAGRRRRSFARPYALIGRAPGADVRLAASGIALRHAYLQLVGGRLACIDLGGGGGLYWDDGRPARSGWLDPGRAVRIGPYELRRPGGASDPVAPEAPGPLNQRWEGAGPDVVLEFPDEVAGPVRWRVGRVLTLVGRAPGCRVRLPDASVSWYHCGLVRTPAGLWAVDLLGRDGLTINETAVHHGRLVDGDVLRVGRYRIVVRHMDAAPALRRVGVPAAARPLEPELVERLATAGPGTALAPALLLLIEQFGHMQQQMLEQFHGALRMMLEQLGAQQREQMQQVRAEMDRMRQLGEELITLRGQVAAGGPAEATSPAAPALPPPPVVAFEPPDPAAETASAAPAAPGPNGAEDPLVLVCRRIAEIRGQQRSGWQKILDLVRTR